MFLPTGQLQHRLAPARRRAGDASRVTSTLVSRMHPLSSSVLPSWAPAGCAKVSGQPGLSCRGRTAGRARLRLRCGASSPPLLCPPRREMRAACGEGR